MVTVIIPTYKRAKYLTRAIDSVLNQTYQDFEVIVVDDNAPDTIERKSTEQIMNKYTDNSQVFYIRHSENKNGAAARNTGIKIANGEYITFLDDDDFYLKNRLEILVNALDNNPKYDAAYSSGVILNNRVFVAKSSGNFQKEILKNNSFFGTGSNIFFRAKVLKELNGFDESFLRHQDLEIMVRFFRRYQILAVNEILVVKDDSSKANEFNIKKLIHARNKFINKFIEDIKQYDDKIAIIQYNYISLLFKTSILKDKKYYYYLKNKILDYGEISNKFQFKILIYGIFKNQIKMLKKIIFKIKFRNLDDKQIWQEIHNMI